jgi:hypothetical protein
MGLQPGEEFEIKLGYKHIRLVHIDDSLDKVEEGEEVEEAVS